jgi:hypothetical protein
MFIIRTVYFIILFLLTLNKFLTYLLMSFTRDAACQLHILGHDGDTFCMNGAQVCILIQASCNAKTAVLWNCRPVLCCCATSQTKFWKGALRMRRSVYFWYHRISQSNVVRNVRYTVRIDVSYMLGIAHHIEVMT